MALGKKHAEPFEILSAKQGWERFGDLTSKAFLDDWRAEVSNNVRPYPIPTPSDQRQILTDRIAEALTPYPAVILYVTHWWNDTNAFTQYRRLLGESRTLSEAPIHLFSGGNRTHIARLLRFVFDLEWDCFLFDLDLQCVVEVRHDGYLYITSPVPNYLIRTLIQFADSDL
jgi:hypothetical protein